MTDFVSGYADRAGIDSRANSALLRIQSIIEDWHIPAAIRLVKIARIMAGEPILTDTCPASYTVRKQEASYGAARESS
jgi:hypothetical protein